MIRPLSRPQARPGKRTRTMPNADSSGAADDQRRGQAIGQHEHHADRQVEPGGQDGQRLRHGDDRQQHALVGDGGRDGGVQAAGCELAK